MKKKTLYILILFLILLGLGALSIHNWEELEQNYKALEPQGKRQIPVEYHIVKSDSIEDWLYAEGTAEANRKAHLTFEVDGRVVELGNIEGAGVIREGLEITERDCAGNKQLLARLQDKDYSEELQIARSNTVQAEKNVDVANAELKQAESRLRLSRHEFKRYEQLISTRTISRQKHEQARSELDIAESALASAQASVASAVAALQASENTLSQAERNFDRTRIYAPWSGTIARVNIEVDDYVSLESLDITSTDAMSATFPITIIDRSKFKVSVEVPLHRLNSITPSDTAFIQSQITEGKAEKNTNLWISAEIFSVSPALSPKARTVRVTLKTTDKFPNILDGELINCKILIQKKQALTIPINALIYKDNKPYVFQINHDDKIVSQKIIQTGIRDNTKIEVVSGLNAGDYIVTRGRQRLKDGSEVLLLEKNSDDR